MLTPTSPIFERLASNTTRIADEHPLGVPAGDAGWETLRATLERCAIALTRDRHESEDLVQETLARLLDKRPEMAEHEGYAVQTLTRLWLTRQRRVRARTRRIRDLAVGRAAGLLGGGGSDPYSAELRGVERAVAALPAVQRSVLVLRTVMGLSTRETAEALETDERSVRAALHRARAAVRARAEQRGAS